jgi:hypothetical protein
MPSKWAGMGYKRLTDIVNNQKMAHLYRKVMKVGPTKNALLAIIDIACREREKETKPNMIINIEGKEKIKDRLWLNSIIEDTARWDVQLTIGGKYEDSDVSWPESRVKTVGPGQHFEIDFMTLNNEVWKKKVNGKYEEVTQGKNLGEDYRHQIKYDQAYISCNGTEVLEVLGTHGDEEKPDLEIRIWERMDEGNMKRGSILKLSNLTPSCGMGCNRRMKWEDVFHKKRMERIIMDNDNYTYDTTIRKVNEVLTQNIPTTKVKDTSIWENIKDHREIIENGMIYTDGAWKDMRSAAERLFRIGGNNSRASSAIIIMSKENDWKKKKL